MVRMTLVGTGEDLALGSPSALSGLGLTLARSVPAGPQSLSAPAGNLQVLLLQTGWDSKGDTAI